MTLRICCWHRKILQMNLNHFTNIFWTKHVHDTSPDLSVLIILLDILSTYSKKKIITGCHGAWPRKVEKRIDQRLMSIKTQSLTHVTHTIFDLKKGSSPLTNIVNTLYTFNLIVRLIGKKIPKGKCGISLELVFQFLLVYVNMSLQGVGEGGHATLSPRNSTYIYY